MTQRPFPTFSELQLCEDGVSTISRHRDAVDVVVRESTRLVTSIFHIGRAGSDGEGDEEAEAGRVVVDHGLPVLSTTTIGEGRAHAAEVPLLLVSSLRVYRRIGSTWKVG